MTGVGSLRRLEQWMIYVRWLGAALGLVELAIADPVPGSNEAFSWALVMLLAVGNGAIAMVLRRIDDQSDYRSFSIIAFSFDAFVIMAAVWNAAGQVPYMVWAVLLLIPLEGALRFGLRGAMVGAAGA